MKIKRAAVRGVLVVAAIIAGTLVAVDVVRPAPDTCPAQVLNSEERIRADIAAAQRAGDVRAELQAMLRGIDAMEARLLGLRQPWVVAERQ